MAKGYSRPSSAFLPWRRRLALAVLLEPFVGLPLGEHASENLVMMGKAGVLVFNRH